MILSNYSFDWVNYFQSLGIVQPTVDYCKPGKWPKLIQNGLPYTIDMVGYLSPYVVYGEVGAEPQNYTGNSVIRVKEVLKHVDGRGIDEIMFAQRRNGFNQPQKLALNCQIKRLRGHRDKRDRRLYFLAKVDDKKFTLLYPPTLRNTRDIRGKSVRTKIAEAICDANTKCSPSVPTLCNKPCDQTQIVPKIKYFGRHGEPNHEVTYIGNGEKFLLMCNLPITKVDPIGKVLTQIGITNTPTITPHVVLLCSVTVDEP